MRLPLGSGPAPRLLAPGVPDWIGADGTRLGWAVRDRLFLHDGSGVVIVELPDHAEEVCPGRARWTVALAAGFVRVDPVAARIEELLVDDEAEPITTRAGEDVGLFVEVPEHRLLRLVDGRPLPLPDGALRARWIRPWAAGFGAAWIDLDMLFRLGQRVTALGRVSGAEGLACGPDGAVMVRLAADTVVVAPRGLAVKVGRPLDADTARFSADGTSALAASPEGVVWVGLADGAVRREWFGNLAPVGFAPGPVLWDQDRGVLLDAEGAVLLDGFAGAIPAAAGRWLAGPGGALWNLDAATRVQEGLGGGVCATDGEQVVHATDRVIQVVGGPAFPHDLCGDDDVVDAARIEGDTLVLATLDGEVGTFGLTDGACRSRRTQRAPWKTPVATPPGVTLPEPDAESRVTVGAASFPLPADAATRVGDEIWVWTRDGQLAALPTG